MVHARRTSDKAGLLPGVWRSFKRPAYRRSRRPLPTYLLPGRERWRRTRDRQQRCIDDMHIAPCHGTARGVRHDTSGRLRAAQHIELPVPVHRPPIVVQPGGNSVKHGGCHAEHPVQILRDSAAMQRYLFMVPFAIHPHATATGRMASLAPEIGNFAESGSPTRR